MKTPNQIGLRPFLSMLPPIVAFIMQWMFWPTIQPFAWFLFFPAVFMSSWIGGLIPGLVSTFISAVLVSWFFIPPEFTFSEKTPMSLISIGLFCIMGILISSFHGRLKRTYKQAKGTNATLLASEERYRLLVDGVKDIANLMLDVNGHVITWNLGAERLKGYTAEEIIGKHFSIFYPPDALEAGKPEAELAQALKHGRVEDEGWRVRKDGSRFWAHVVITALYNDEGEIQGFSKITRDITERKVAEDQLRASEENLSVTLNSIGDAVMTTDAEGRVTRLNFIAEQLTGWSHTEAVGHPVADIFHVINQKTRQPAPIPVEATLAQGVIHGLANDTVLIARDGKETPIADSCAPIRHRDGSVIGAVLVFRDVSSEYATQAALHDSATRIQTILNTVADGIISINEQGIIETLNPAAERIFKYTSAEVVGQNVSILMPEPYHGQHDGYLKRYLTTGEARIIDTVGREVEGRRKDGSTFPLELAVSEMWLGDRRYFTGITRDISARKAAENQFDRFFALSLDMLCISSADGYFKRVNPAFTQTLGWSTEEILARPFLFFVHPDDHAATLREVERQVAAGESVMKFENRYLHKDGSWRILSWASVPDSDGLMFATARDVTASKQVARSLVAAKEQAELANRAKDSFLATMSHEIRTPLTGMLGMMELLSLTRLDSEQHTTLDVAWDSGRGLLRIVSDILDWSKIEEGKLELSPHPTSITQLLQGVVNTYSRIASAKSLTLWQHPDARLKSAYIVDPLRLSQVLNNFVSNAIKFTQQGEIELRAELLEHLESGDRIRFSVKDTGIGINSEVQAQLFQRYRQESADTARMYGGTGLGLAICRRLAEMMDGQIELKSEQGHGSIFSITLTLPVSGEPGETVRSLYPEVQQREVHPLLTNSMNAPLVLAVDDHPTNRDLLARQIKLLGLRAETAENGQIALSMWRDGRFALIITDCHMPEMNGYELSQEIRKIEIEESRSRTPIIAWTANALAEEAEHCHAAGMDELLVKPADLQQVKKMLAKWLSITDTEGAQSSPSRHEDKSGQIEPIDYAVLNMVITDRAAQAQVLEDFQSHIRADHAKLLKMFEQDDRANVESTAHRMKGSSRMVGAQYLAAACASIEQAARNGDMDGARTAKDALDVAIGQLEAFLIAANNPGRH